MIIKSLPNERHSTPLHIGRGRGWVCLFLLSFLPFNLSAQTYLEHLQQNTQGLGTVSVTQSPDIDKLVNGDPEKAKALAEKAKAAENAEKEKEEKKDEAKEKSYLRPDMPSSEGEGEVEVDMSKKVMRNSHNVTGYRVQAYAGGNTREAKQKANEARDKIKRAYPSEPVYVHFFSPRWICRVGNYRTPEEANRMLANIRKLGFTQAVVVKGKITVQY